MICVQKFQKAYMSTLKDKANLGLSGSFPKLIHHPPSTTFKLNNITNLIQGLSYGCHGPTSSFFCLPLSNQILLGTKLIIY